MLAMLFLFSECLQLCMVLCLASLLGCMARHGFLLLEKRGIWFLFTQSSQKQDFPNSAFLLGLKFFHLIKSLAHRHFILTWVAVKWVSPVITSSSPATPPPFFLPVEQMGRCNTLKS